MKVVLFLLKEGEVLSFVSFSLKHVEQTPGTCLKFGCLLHFDESDSEKPML